jgi:cytochrome c5
MHRLLASCFLGLALVACASGDGAPAPGAAVAATDVVPRTPIVERAERGRAVYEEVCARCHAQGLDGAPVPGRPGDWDNRSRLWQSVLFEHAKQGYLKMPARGGEQSLAGEDVEAAAEYMLGIAYPRSHTE